MEGASQEPERFAARQAIERLRSGVFDPLAVRRLTAGADRLEAAVSPLLSGEVAHLCICGAYGQGKSHSLRWAADRALADGFAVSLVSLDPREVPFHDQRTVYRALIKALQLPAREPHAVTAPAASGVAELVSRWVALVAARSGEPEALLPRTLPRLVGLVLSGLARQTIRLDALQRRQRQHSNYYPPRYGPDLQRALQGYPIPAHRLRAALRYRSVPDYKASLRWGDNASVLESLHGLALLMRSLGLMGWVVLFDECEAIAAARPSSREKSWSLLRQLLAPGEATSALRPVFAFTEELLWKMEAETRLRRNQLHLLQLKDLSPAEWSLLSEKLTALHGAAYRWRPDGAVSSALRGRLDAMRGRETRLLLKGLVDELDLLDQANTE